jgi:hypothetical protein
MNEPKHTPGPWRYLMKLVTYDIWSDSYGKVAYCYTTDCDKYSPSDSTARANARLIAAAPEMLEALKYLTAEVDHCVNNGWLRKQPQYKAALAAIAKAQGRER